MQWLYSSSTLEGGRETTVFVVSLTGSSARSNQSRGQTITKSDKKISFDDWLNDVFTTDQHRGLSKTVNETLRQEEYPNALYDLSKQSCSQKLEVITFSIHCER